jgi:hypothetical protein
MSPDPSGLYYADISNPQSMNLYIYALNNPLINTDPSGMECVWDDGSYNSADDLSTGNAGGCSSQGGTYVDPGLFENALLTNGSNANIQYGSWSGQANSTIASSWTNSSLTITSTPNPALTLSVPTNVWNWAFQRATPVGGPWHYGNWAGLGGMGAPINNADAGAMMHDYCYAANGNLNAGANFCAHNGALQACNQALCDTEKSVMTKNQVTKNQVTKNQVTENQVTTPGDRRDVTHVTQQQLHTSGRGSPSTLVQRIVRSASHPNGFWEGDLPFGEPTPGDQHQVTDGM